MPVCSANKAWSAIRRSGNNSDECAESRVIQKRQLPRTVLDYIKLRLGKWVEWKYIIRKAKVDTIRPVFCYSINKRGEQFIEDVFPGTGYRIT